MKKKVAFKTGRYIVLSVFILILSVLYKIVNYLQRKITYKANYSSADHDAKVKQVQRQVRQWKDSGSKKLMCCARPHWKGNAARYVINKNEYYKIKVDLENILEINTEKGFIKVEPLVTVGELTSVLGSLGWMVPMVPEFEDLTIGGLSNSSGLETSGHIYGTFQHVCLAYELVVSDGSLVRCTKDENSDIFYSIPWSHGTIGFVVAIELLIVPAKKYVKLEYRPFYNNDDIIKDFKTECTKKEPHFFLEGVMYNKNTGVIMVGDMTDDAEPDKINYICRYHKRAFYNHVETYLHKGKRGVEYILLRDYIHRHCRDLFWLIIHAVPYADSAIFRYLLGWILPLQAQYAKILRPDSDIELFEKYIVVQDMIVPIDKMEGMIDLADKELNVYPIWLCGSLVQKNPGFIHPRNAEDENEMFVDVGIFGVAQVDNYDPFKALRTTEAYIRQSRGFLGLYAFIYMTEEEFRQMYDHTLYDRVRRKLGCQNALADVYQKVRHQKKTFTSN